MVPRCIPVPSPSSHSNPSLQRSHSETALQRPGTRLAVQKPPEPAAVAARAGSPSPPFTRRSPFPRIFIALRPPTEHPCTQRQKDKPTVPIGSAWLRRIINSSSGVGDAYMRPAWIICGLVTTASTSPYSTASAALMKKSRSVSSVICSSDWPVNSACEYHKKDRYLENDCD
jgi:hypothetical protein